MKADGSSRRSTAVRGAVLVAIVVTALVGCSPSVPPVGTRFSAATRAWWTYTRAATYDFMATDIVVPMRDGTPIGCSLGRPSRDGAPAEGRFPGLIVEFTPYVLMGEIFNREARFFGARGYNTLVCTLRGIGRSGGTWQHGMSSQDGRDAHDLVEWLGVQPFSDGRIGQFGESYGGQTSYGAAVERPAHLVAVAPMQPPSNLYDDVIYPGGIKSTEGGLIDNWPQFSPLLSAGGVDARAEYAINRAHPTFDAYWQDRSLVDRYRQIQVPVLTIGGWDDGFFRSGTLAAIERAPGRTWAIYGPWPHLPMVAFDDPCVLCPPDPLPAGVLLAWFDHWIKRLPDADMIPADPTFVSYEGPVGVGAGWQELSWDPAGRDVTTFELGADGRLARRAAPGTAVFDEPKEPSDPRGSVTFTTDELVGDRVLEGHASLELRASLSASDANLYVEVVDVDVDGHETVVNDGFLLASHRSSHIDPTPVPPGRFLDYTIPVRADDYRFASGHRLRVRISGGSSNALNPPTLPVVVTISTGPRSKLSMPGFARS